MLHFVQFFVWFSIFNLLQVEDMTYITGVLELGMQGVQLQTQNFVGHNS